MIQSDRQATVPPRSAIDPQYTWNAESVFSTPADWQAECDDLKAHLGDVQHFQGRLHTSPEVLFEALETQWRFIARVNKLSVYTNMSYSVDTNDQVAAAMDGQLRALQAQLEAATAFIAPEVLSIGHDTLQQWMARFNKLAVYRMSFDNLFRRQAHVRSAEVEEVLGLVNDPFRSVPLTGSLLTNADMHFAPARSSQGEELPVTQSTITTVLLLSPDRETRRTAYESYADTHLSLKNTLGSNLVAGIKQDVFRARVRRYGSSLEAALDPYNLPVAVFHNLVNTFRKNIPTWHRYWAVRRKMLGVETLHPYDIHAPLAVHDPEVTYQQAVDWICEGMSPLGEDYVSTLRQGCLHDRWVDVYPNLGKRQGAFSSGAPGTMPFIMMSFGGNLKSMSTLAHELGHSLHSYLTRKHQPLVYANYSMFVAETASNFNQAMVRAHLLETNPDPAFQVAAIDEAMNNFHRYFFIMPTLARFELEIHERAERGQAVTADDMIVLMADLFGEGYGSELAFEREREGITWGEFSTHLYANFYVFQYATGISAAHALSARILKGETNAVEDYLRFLKAGSSLYPLEALKVAGVDMTTPDAVETTFGVLDSMVARLEELSGGK